VRLKVPDKLKDRAKQVYEDAGYKSEGDLMRDGIRRRIEDLDSHGDND